MDATAPSPVGLDEPVSLGEQTVTTGDWPTEADSASAFDGLIASCDLFRSYHEVAGVLTQPRAGQVDKTVRIDRVLIPNERLVNLGWQYGAIGIEIKRSGVRFGPAIAQALDYVRSTWRVRGIWIQLDAVFVWPMAKQYGPLASVMSHNRVGSATSSGWSKLLLKIGEEPVLYVSSYDGKITLGARPAGRKVGSR